MPGGRRGASPFAATVLDATGSDNGEPRISSTGL